MGEKEDGVEKRLKILMLTLNETIGTIYQTHAGLGGSPRQST